MFVDGPEFFLVLAQLDTEGNILTKFKKKSNQWSWRRCHNKKCLQTDSWTGQTPESFKTVRKAPLDYIQKSNNIKMYPQKGPQI